MEVYGKNRPALAPRPQTVKRIFFKQSMDHSDEICDDLTKEEKKIHLFQR